MRTSGCGSEFRIEVLTGRMEKTGSIRVVIQRVLFNIPLTSA